MCLQSSFFIGNKSSSGSFPHGQGLGHQQCSWMGSGGWEAGTQLSRTRRKGETALWRVKLPGLCDA